MAEFVLRYTASIGFDRRLALADIEGSLAHAAMLARQQIIGADDLAAIERGLLMIRGEIERGGFDWRLELEDVHLNIEKRLTDLVGDAGKRLHTGRSRNDQVATDLRLWLRGEIDRIIALLRELQGALVEQAARHADTVMPGFTHLQVAQPVTFGHHLLAYVEMFERDRERLADARRRVNRLPLGAAALAGTTFPIDRAFVAERLGFEAIADNSLDAVSDRDFAIEFTAAAALIMVHVSRLAEELVLWMSPRYGFIRLPDRFTTGSSIMPQKKNPDVPELARGNRPPDGAADADEGPAAHLQQGQPGRQGAAVRHRRHAARHPARLCRDGARHRGRHGGDAGGSGRRPCPECRFAKRTRSSHARSGWQRRAVSTWRRCRSPNFSPSRRGSAPTSTRCSASTARWPPATIRAAPRRHRSGSGWRSGAGAWPPEQALSQVTDNRFAGCVRAEGFA